MGGFDDTAGDTRAVFTAESLEPGVLVETSGSHTSLGMGLKNGTPRRNHTRRSQTTSQDCDCDGEEDWGAKGTCLRTPRKVAAELASGSELKVS